MAKFILKLSAFRSNFTLSVSILYFYTNRHFSEIQECTIRHFSEIQECTVTIKYKQYVLKYSIVSSEELLFINNNI